MNIRLTPNRTVHNFSAPYVIAEIGANHNGDMELAQKMVDMAVACGCDAVKFQSWTPDSLIATEEYERNTSYNDDPKKHWGSLREMVEAYYLRADEHKELKTYCDQKGVDFCSTPFSSREADLLEELDVPFYKIASMDINNLRLLAHVATFKKPVIISTGMATLGEIEQAIRIIEEAGNDQIILLHCVSVYPPKMETINLRNITMLQQAFGYPVGFSDHTIGSSIPLASVALGACIIEKHFTIDKNLPGWDHAISADPEEMKVICDESNNICRAMGKYRRELSDDEIKKKMKFRRSIVTRRELRRGEILRAADLEVKRPGTGIPPDQIDFVAGRVLRKDQPKDALLNWEDFE